MKRKSWEEATWTDEEGKTHIDIGTWMADMSSLCGFSGDAIYSLVSRGEYPTCVGCLTIFTEIKNSKFKWKIKGNENEI